MRKVVVVMLPHSTVRDIDGLLLRFPPPATPPHITQPHTIETVCSGYPEMTDLTDFRVLLCSVQGRQDVEESVVWR